jgi:hypothetical protein
MPNKKEPQTTGGSYQIFRKILRGTAAAGVHHFRDRIAFPHSEQQNLCTGGIFENVKYILQPLKFEKTRAARIGLCRRTVR